MTAPFVRCRGTRTRSTSDAPSTSMTARIFRSCNWSTRIRRDAGPGTTARKRAFASCSRYSPTRLPERAFLSVPTLRGPRDGTRRKPTENRARDQDQDQEACGGREILDEKIGEQ